MIAMLAVAASILFPSGDATDDGVPGQVDAGASDGERWAFADLEDVEIDEGEEWTLQPELTGAKPGESITYQLGGRDIPFGLSIDTASGEMSWQPSEEDGSGSWNVRVEAILEGQVVPVATTTIKVSVVETDQPPEIRAIGLQSVEAGQTLRLLVSASDVDEPTYALRFRLGPDAPEGATINENTGEFEWTPPAGTGPGAFEVTVLAASTNDLNRTASETFRIGVEAPSSPFRLKPITGLKVVQGQSITVPLKANRNGGGVIPPLLFELAPESPGGTKIGREDGTFIWQTSTETEPKLHNIQVLVALAATPDRKQIQLLSVEVTEAPTAPATGVDTPAKTGPSDEELAAAEEKARELYRREIAAARSTNERAELAMRFLTRAKEAGDTPMALALFRMSLDYATRARALALALDAIRLSAIRFPTDPVAENVKTFDEYRFRGSTWFDKQQAIEIGLANALKAVEQHRYTEAVRLIEIPESIARQNKEGELALKLKTAVEFAKTLEAEVGERPDGSESPGAATRPADVELSDTAKLARNELLAILKSMQFQTLFNDGPSASFFRHSDNDLPDLGRSLWTIGEGNVRMDEPQMTANSGFVDRSISMTNYTLRMNVSSDTTSGMLLLGLPQTGAFEGLRLHVGSQQFCFLRLATGRQFIARPQGTVARSSAGWDQVEVHVTPGHLTVLVNNVRVIDTDVSAQTSGFAGIDAFLGSAAQARCRIENIRVRSASEGT